ELRARGGHLDVKSLSDLFDAIAARETLCESRLRRGEVEQLSQAPLARHRKIDRELSRALDLLRKCRCIGIAPGGAAQHWREAGRRSRRGTAVNDSDCNVPSPSG